MRLLLNVDDFFYTNTISKIIANNIKQKRSHRISGILFFFIKYLNIFWKISQIEK